MKKNGNNINSTQTSSNHVVVSLGSLYADSCAVCGGRAVWGLATQKGPNGCVEAVKAGRVYCDLHVASPIPVLDMRDIARSGHVTRWHSVRTARDQTLAEHHYMVSMIVDHLLEHIFADAISLKDYKNMIRYALKHDEPELLTGDCSSVLKRLIKAVTNNNSPIDAIENLIDPELSSLRSSIEPLPCYPLIKIADYMDAILFITEEGIGNHAKVVQDELTKLLQIKIEQAREDHPDFEWDLAINLFDLMRSGEGNQIALEAETTFSRKAV